MWALGGPFDPHLPPPGNGWGVQMFFLNYYAILHSDTTNLWQIFPFLIPFIPLKPKITKKCQNSLNYPPWGGQGGSDQKIFFQKVITHQDATFLGQKFFSKTNILGSQFFSDPLGSKIRKIAKTGPYGPLFFGEFAFSQPPRHTGREKPWETRSMGGCSTPPCICPTILKYILFMILKCRF